GDGGGGLKVGRKETLHRLGQSARRGGGRGGGPAPIVLREPTQIGQGVGRERDRQRLLRVAAIANEAAPGGSESTRGAGLTAAAGADFQNRTVTHKGPSLQDRKSVV